MLTGNLNAEICKEAVSKYKVKWSKRRKDWIEEY